MSIKTTESLSSNQNQIINRTKIFSFKMLKLLGILVMVAKCGFATKEATGCIGKCPAIETPLSVLLVHKDCTKYCQCQQGSPVILNCGPGEHFSPDKKQCLPEVTAGCKSFDVNNIDFFPTVDNIVFDGCKSKCLKNNTGLIAHEDVIKYCLCINGKLSIEKCPKDLHSVYQVNIPNDLSLGCVGTCPVCQDPDAIILLAHEECRKYCRCDNGWPVLWDCPHDWHFSTEYGTCMRPDEAGCETKPPVTPSPPDDTEGCIGTCPADQDPNQIILLAHKKCRNYCRCDNGWPILRKCPQNLHFSVKHGKCMKPEEAECDGSKPPVTPSPPVDTEGCIGTCPADQDPNQIILLAHKKCRNYCRCDNGWPILRECPQNLHFSVKHGKCMKPEEAECDGSKPPVTPPSTDAEGCIGTCPAQNSPDYTVHLPHEECSKFCKCNWGKPYVFQCRKGLYFNPKLEVCDYPSNVNCAGIGSIINWRRELQNSGL